MMTDPLCPMPSRAIALFCYAPKHNKLGHLSRAMSVMFFRLSFPSNAVNCQCVHAILRANIQRDRGGQQVPLKNLPWSRGFRKQLNNSSR